VRAGRHVTCDLSNNWQNIRQPGEAAGRSVIVRQELP
jgi:hypothetical protein